MAQPKVNVPPMKDLTIDNITENTILTNSQCPDQRLTYLMERLVTHLHDFARETRLSTKEWMAALDFLVGVGQISSDVRHVSLNPIVTHAIEEMEEQTLMGLRNSSSSPTSSASPSSSTQSTTPNHLPPRKAPSSVPSTPMTPPPSQTAPPSPLIQLANRFLCFVP
jgi:hypothetical protein